MSRTIDVRTEMRRIAGSKPVHAAAGAGVLASEALRELPARLARLRADAAVPSLPARASGYMTGARARAVKGYDNLADRGRRAMGRRSIPGRSVQGGKTK